MEEIGSLLEPYTRRFFLERISHYPIEIHVNQKATHIRGSKIDLVDSEGKVSSLEFDDLVLCLGTVANNELMQALLGRFQEVYSIGDCVSPKNICQAVSEGNRIGRLI
jgi:thioredoxin reductase